MSARGRGKAKTPADAHMTTHPLALACLGLMEIENHSFVLEPSAGDGVWLRALRELHPAENWDLFPSAVELRPECEPRLRESLDLFPKWIDLHFSRFEDYTHRPKRGSDRPAGHDVIFGNPPYSAAAEHVQQAHFLLRDGGQLGFLLRLNLLGSIKRRSFWRQFRPKYVYVCEERPSFSSDGRTDATEYGFFIWERGWQGETSLDWFSWRDPVKYADDQSRILESR